MLSKGDEAKGRSVESEAGNKDAAGSSASNKRKFGDAQNEKGEKGKDGHESMNEDEARRLSGPLWQPEMLDRQEQLYSQFLPHMQGSGNPLPYPAAAMGALPFLPWQATSVPPLGYPGYPTSFPPMYNPLWQQAHFMPSAIMMHQSAIMHQQLQQQAAAAALRNGHPALFGLNPLGASTGMPYSSPVISHSANSAGAANNSPKSTTSHFPPGRSFSGPTSSVGVPLESMNALQIKQGERLAHSEEERDSPNNEVKSKYLLRLDEFLKTKSSDGEVVEEETSTPGTNAPELPSRRIRQRGQGVGVLSGVMKVAQEPNPSWVAQVTINGAEVVIGEFTTSDQAARAYDRCVLYMREVEHRLASDLKLNYPNDIKSTLASVELSQTFLQKLDSQSSAVRVKSENDSGEAVSTNEPQDKDTKTGKEVDGTIGPSSKYRGVCWNKSNFSWKASIKIHGKNTHIGYYDDMYEAALAYDLRAIDVRGDRAILNFGTNFPQELKIALRKSGGRLHKK